MQVLYFQNSYIYIKILLITSPKRKPLIKNSNISITQDYITCLLQYTKREILFAVDDELLVGELEVWFHASTPLWFLCVMFGHIFPSMQPFCVFNLTYMRNAGWFWLGIVLSYVWHIGYVYIFLWEFYMTSLVLVAWIYVTCQF